MSRWIKLIVIVVMLRSSLLAEEFKHTKIIYYKPVPSTTTLQTGLDLLIQHDFKTISGKKVAVLYNEGSYNRDGEHILDIMKNPVDFKLTAILEVREKTFDTESSRMMFYTGDSARDINYVVVTPANPRVYEKDLNGANLILIDLQNIGVRYDNVLDVLISVLTIGSESRIPIVILDRPNPITATITEGPLSVTSTLKANARIPWRYGLTIGELATLFNEENWIPGEKSARLYVIPMVNYIRSRWFDQLKLPWRLPIEDIYTVEVLLSYCTVCYFDYSNVSYGPGGRFAYQVGGAPWIGGKEILEILNQQQLTGVKFDLVEFVPGSQKVSAQSGLYTGQECNGIRIIISDREKYRIGITGAMMLGTIGQMYPHHFKLNDQTAIDNLFGDRLFRMLVETGEKLETLPPLWISEMTPYQKIRQKYLLYTAE
jgi:uncharacterized protein YbbC (DUF1343 family)